MRFFWRNAYKNAESGIPHAARWIFRNRPRQDVQVMHDHGLNWNRIKLFFKTLPLLIEASENGTKKHKRYTLSIAWNMCRSSAKRPVIVVLRRIKDSIFVFYELCWRSHSNRDTNQNRICTENCNKKKQPALKKSDENAFEKWMQRVTMALKPALNIVLAIQQVGLQLHYKRAFDFAKHDSEGVRIFVQKSTWKSWFRTYLHQPLLKIAL